MVLRNRYIRQRAEKNRAAERQHRHRESHKYARDQLETPANRAQRIEQQPPAQLGDRGEKIEAFWAAGAVGQAGGEGAYASHVSSWPVSRAPPTISRKICSSVSFSCGLAAAARSPSPVPAPATRASPPLRNSSIEPCATSRP